VYSEHYVKLGMWND